MTKEMQELIEAAEGVLAHVEDMDLPRVGNHCTLCYTYRKMLRDAISAALAYEGGWIEINPGCEMPDMNHSWNDGRKTGRHSDPVEVCTPNGIEIGDYARFDGGDGCWSTRCGETLQASHWRHTRPLPSPPLSVEPETPVKGGK